MALPVAARLVACWNACAGIPTEALEAGALADFLTQCKELGDESDLLAKLRGEA